MARRSERFSEREKHATKRSRVDEKAAEGASAERKARIDRFYSLSQSFGKGF